MNWKRTSLGVITVAFLAAFPWGPLFAWSPVHPGYRQVKFSRVDVLYPDSLALDPAYRQVDEYLATAENFHELKCSKKIKVVVCGDWNDCLRFAAPYLAGQRPLAVTDATGTAVFVTPKANGWTDIGGLLRHELSHAVQSQNNSLVSVLRMLRQPWVTEGVAGVVAAEGVTEPVGIWSACRNRSSCCERRRRTCGHCLRSHRRTGVSAIRPGFTSGIDRLNEAGRQTF